MGLVKYGSYSVEQAQKDREEAARSGGSADFWRVPSGKSSVRFLPPRVGRTDVFRVQYQHFIRVPGATNVVSFVCPRMQAKQDKITSRFCPACQKLDQLREDGSPGALDQAKDMEPKRRVLTNIIFRGDPERGVLIWGFGKQVQDQLVALRDDQDSGGDWSDPIRGFDIVVEKTGQGIKTEYKILPARKITRLADDETMNAWLDSMHDLDRHARIPSDEEIRRLTGGGGRDRPRDDDRVPAAVRGAPQQRRRTAADDAIDTDGEVVDE